MNTMSRFHLRLIAIVILIIGPTACNLFYGTCPDTLPYFKITGMQLSNYGFTNAEGNAVKLETPNEAVPWDKYFLRVDFDQSFHAQINTRGPSTLFALSCDDNGSNGALTGVDTLYLISLEHYNDDYTANDTLNSIVQVNTSWTASAKNLENDFADLENHFIDNDENIRYPYFSLKLAAAPSKSEGEYQFKLVYILDNGETFSKESSLVLLRR